MPTYYVPLTVYYTLLVEADSPAAAREKAAREYEDGELGVLEGHDFDEPWTPDKEV